MSTVRLEGDMRARALDECERRLYRVLSRGIPLPAIDSSRRARMFE